MPGDKNFTSSLVVSQDTFDFAFANICVHTNILRRESHTEMDNNSLNVFGNGLSLRHIDGGITCGNVQV